MLEYIPTHFSFSQQETLDVHVDHLVLSQHEIVKNLP